MAGLTGRKSVVCRRCGWRARRRWQPEDDRPPKITNDATDPALTVLDNKLASRLVVRTEDEPELKLIDLETLQDVPLSPNPPKNGGREVPRAAVRRMRTGRRSSRGMAPRLSAARRREILGGIAIAALATFIVATLILAGSCGQQAIETISENAVAAAPHH